MEWTSIEQARSSKTTMEQSKTKTGRSDSDTKPSGRVPADATTQAFRHTSPVEQGGITMEEINKCMSADSKLQDELVPFLCEALEDMVMQHNEARDAAAGPLTAAARRGESLRAMLTPTAFVKRMLKHGECSSCLVVVALMYLARLEARLGRGLLMAGASFQTKLLVAVVVAGKFCEDGGADNALWAKIGGVPVRRLNELEFDLVEGIEWDLSVQPEEYKAFLATLLVQRVVPPARRGSADEFLSRRSSNTSPLSSLDSTPNGPPVKDRDAAQQQERAVQCEPLASAPSPPLERLSSRRNSLGRAAPRQRRVSVDAAATASPERKPDTKRRGSVDSGLAQLRRRSSYGLLSFQREPSSAKRSSTERSASSSFSPAMSGRKSLKDMLSGANTPTAWASADAKLGRAPWQGSSPLKSLKRLISREPRVKMSDGKQTTKYSDLTSRMGTLDKLLVIW